MSGWRRCDTCRKVRPADDFDGDAATCRPCLTAPAPAPPRKRTTTVSTRRTTPRPPAAPAAPVDRGPRLGSVGSGDLEVRERRARRAATDALVEQYPQEHALLLRDARAREGLRPLAAEPGPAPSADQAPAPTPEPADEG